MVRASGLCQRYARIILTRHGSPNHRSRGSARRWIEDGIWPPQTWSWVIAKLQRRKPAKFQKTDRKLFRQYTRKLAKLALNGSALRSRLVQVV